MLNADCTVAHILATVTILGRNLKSELVAIDVIVVGIDIVDLFLWCRIALCTYMILQGVNHLGRNHKPARSVVLNVGIDWFKHTGLLKERKEVKTCAVACKLHPVHLLLARCIVF